MSEHHLSNQKIIDLCQINRVFLSQILNNKVEKKSYDYLAQKKLILEKHISALENS